MKSYDFVFEHVLELQPDEHFVFAGTGQRLAPSPCQDDRFAVALR